MWPPIFKGPKIQARNGQKVDGGMNLFHFWNVNDWIRNFLMWKTKIVELTPNFREQKYSLP